MKSASEASYQYVPVPAFEDNYIWVMTDGHSAVVVDPGDAAPVESWLREHGVKLIAILLTHHHADHVGGVATLLRTFSGPEGIPVYGPAAESIPVVSRALKGGDTIELDEPYGEFAVLDVPGHTRGHIAYVQHAGGDGAPHLFCGDTLFASGCGRLFEGTAAQMLASLDSLVALDDDTQVHCAHEYTLSNIRFALACEPANPDLQAWSIRARELRDLGRPTLPTTIGHEKRVNPFLRADQSSVREHVLASASARGANGSSGMSEAGSIDRLGVFAAMREWKNTFR
ncbi:hydroxyacylglutathione hydrolase [Pararobbsia alpina]|uniref:Hydroxyacylglutathione hydrolase n=1 Tax=Pararobbsia alpina TaxID=621374 RepID=A0A6S7CDM2_9BURK|nr:hydroxyacylglutathione hydrolase [Pararobbsia alpina]CAB3787174.1 Hydroxyacylglutathione hydrolase [Pararobbsia alpina]